jgi:hypothetical protein
MTFILLDLTFWEVVWGMLLFFLFTMAIWLFISLFADIFRRRDLSGWAKAGWIALLFIIPWIGALIYMIARPAPTKEEVARMRMGYNNQGGPHMATDDIAKAHELLKQGALTQQEFDEIKARALA